MDMFFESDDTLNEIEVEERIKKKVEEDEELRLAMEKVLYILKNERGLGMSKLKCKFCEKEFLTVEKDNFLFGGLKIVVPHPSEEAVNLGFNLRNIGAYACKECYSRYSNIVKEKMLNSSQTYLKNISKLYEDAERKYKDEVTEINKKKAYVTKIVHFLQTTEYLSDLPQHIIEDISRKRTPFIVDYYDRLKEAIEWEKNEKFNKKTIYAWTKEYDIEFIELWSEVNQEDIVSKEEYFNILLNSKVKNKSTVEIFEIIERG